MPVFTFRLPMVAALGAVLLLAPACSKVRSHQGYVIDADLVNAIQPGTDNRQSVLATLGRPTLTSQFNQNGEWYYVSRDSRNLAFNAPAPSEQVTLRIRFDANGTVAGVDRTGRERVVSINPSNRVTPTLGRKRGFFQDLFGNIGQVGAAGVGGNQGPNRDNGLGNRN